MANLISNLGFFNTSATTATSNMITTGGTGATTDGTIWLDNQNAIGFGQQQTLAQQAQQGLGAFGQLHRDYDYEKDEYRYSRSKKPDGSPRVRPLSLREELQTETDKWLKGALH